MTAIDVDRARRETPGCAHVLHFNNAGASLMPAPVVDAQIAHLRREAEIGGYEAAEDAAHALAHTYDALARLLGCDADEVALVENATRAWGGVFYAFPFEPGDRILTHRASYASNYLAFLQVARRTGAVVDVVPSDAHGAIDVDALRDRIDDRVRLIALTHIPTNGGLVNPAEAVGAVARAAGVPYLLDACQSAGQRPLDVERIGCDALSAAGRKFLRGPRGTGFLYVRRALAERLEPSALDLRAATWTRPDAYALQPGARRFETWEGHVAGKIALGVAADYARGWGLDAIRDRVSSLAATLRAALSGVPGVTVHDAGQERGGIVTFAAVDRPATALQAALRARRINTSVVHPNATLLDAEARRLPPLVRASVHYFNTEDEIDRFTAAVRSLC